MPDRDKRFKPGSIWEVRKDGKNDFQFIILGVGVNEAGHKDYNYLKCLVKYIFREQEFESVYKKSHIINFGKFMDKTYNIKKPKKKCTT